MKTNRGVLFNWKDSLKPSVLATVAATGVSKAKHHYQSEKNRRRRLKLGRHLLADLGFAADGNPLPALPEPSDGWRRVVF